MPSDPAETKTLDYHVTQQVLWNNEVPNKEEYNFRKSDNEI